MVSIISPLHSQYFECRAYFSVILIFHSKYSKTKSSIFFHLISFVIFLKNAIFALYSNSNITNAHLPLGVNIGTQYFLNVALVELCIDYCEKKMSESFGNLQAQKWLFISKTLQKLRNSNCL